MTRKLVAGLFSATLLFSAAACSSTKEEAKDAIEEVIAETGLEGEQADCLRAKVDAYSEEELEEIESQGDAESIEDMGPAAQKFIDDLTECMMGA
jgi:hypothetical protein